MTFFTKPLDPFRELVLKGGQALLPMGSLDVACDISVCIGL